MGYRVVRSRVMLIQVLVTPTNLTTPSIQKQEIISEEIPQTNHKRANLIKTLFKIRRLRRSRLHIISKDQIIRFHILV